MIRPWQAALIGIAAALTVIGVQSFQRAGDAFEAGQSALASGDSVAAVESFRRVVRWRFPGNAYPRKALEALERIAKNAESQGDADLALLAWRSIAGSIASTRTAFGMPDADRRAQASDRIAAIISASGMGEEAVTAHRAALDAPPSATAVGTLLLLLGFAGWVWSVARWPSAAVFEDGTPRSARGLHTVLVVVAAAVFVLGIFLA